MKFHAFRLKDSISAESKIPRIMCNGNQRRFYGLYSRYWHKYANYRSRIRNRYKRYLYITERNFYYGVYSEQTGFNVAPGGCIANCKRFPCIACPYYYGEIHECMYGETHGNK